MTSKLREGRTSLKAENSDCIGTNEQERMLLDRESIMQQSRKSSITI